MAVRVQVPPSAPTFEEAPISGAFFLFVLSDWSPALSGFYKKPVVLAGKRGFYSG